MNKLFNNRGFTLVEVIMTLAILGVVICPLMNLLILSQKINNAGEAEYKSIQTAQYYMEEIKAMNEIDTGMFIYNSAEMCYEKIVIDNANNYCIEIRITPNYYGLHYIEIDILSEEEVINSLMGSVVYK